MARQIACDRLHYHPVFVEPETFSNDPETSKVAKDAKSTCHERVWQLKDDAPSKH